MALVAAPAAGSPPSATVRAQVPYDVEAIRAELAADGVAVYRSGVDRQALVRVVADARHAGLQLSVVVLVRDPAVGDARELGQLAMELRSGADTVLVITPSWIAADSGELSRRQVERALDEAERGLDTVENPDEVAVAQEFADAALRQGMPWLLPVLAGIALTVTALLAGFWWGRRRRRTADTVTLTQISDRLSEEVRDLGAAMVRLHPLAAAADLDTQRRYAELRTAFREVREQAEQLISYRKDSDRIVSRLTAMRTSLDEVRATLEAGQRSA